MKFIFFIASLFICTLLVGCGGKNNDEYKDPEAVTVEANDRSVQFYLPMNIQAFANGQQQTIDDLRPSGRLLLTPGGNVKAAEYSNGYKKVYSFRCESIGYGWYKVTCWLKNYDHEYTLECYTRDRL